ncbi:uncharacterized protein LOC119262021 [Pygocentrus nattereri]|uniref:uncharacterized protein LOC119262021 n=1 Tax=Pygocentrus nattereri TaxID=42514 RepID=UPI001891DA17|nr:uncharacterized protein LOC119262021 [Pygocentrus nattereri]
MDKYDETEAEPERREYSRSENGIAQRLEGTVPTAVRTLNGLTAFVSERDGKIKRKWFTAAPGSYECSVTGLRWESSSEVELEYCWSNWELVSEVLVREQYHPGGPLLDITVVRGTLNAVHLPHFLCLDSLDSLSDEVRVLHVEDAGITLEKFCTEKGEPQHRDPKTQARCVSADEESLHAEHILLLPNQTTDRQIDLSKEYAVWFVSNHRNALIQRVSLVAPIAVDLKSLLGGEKYSTIMKCETPQEQMRKLYSFRPH